MSVEDVRNRDLFLKYCFMVFITHILSILGIDEEVLDVMPTEQISFQPGVIPKIFNIFLDFKILTKSGKILIFEFKKDAIKTSYLEQTLKYYKNEYCKSNNNVQLIIISLSKGGKIKQYTHYDITFHPRIIKTKEINKEKDLSRIRYKFKNNQMLTRLETSLLVTLPLFETGESERDITYETCKYIQNQPECIPENLTNEITAAMYFNIIEYIEPENQEQLMEDMGMEEKYEGTFTLLRKEERNIGKKEGKIEGWGECANRLLETHTFEEVSNLLQINPTELSNILKQN